LCLFLVVLGWGRVSAGNDSAARCWPFQSSQKGEGTFSTRQKQELKKRPKRQHQQSSVRQRQQSSVLACAYDSDVSMYWVAPVPTLTPTSENNNREQGRRKEKPRPSKTNEARTQEMKFPVARRAHSTCDRDRVLA